MIEHFSLDRHDREPERLSFEYTRMYNAGYVGRNQEEVRKHVKELAARGVPAPSSTPALYAVGCHCLCTASEVEVYGDETSGEAEYVLLVDDEKSVCVGLGSDHTDRFLEKTDIPRSKQICPNMIATNVWALEDVAAHWDDILMRSYVIKNGGEVLYQEGTLSAIFSPAQLMAFVKDRTGAGINNSVLFSGTLSLKTGDFLYGEGFRAELVDPVLGRKLTLSYNVRTLGSLNPGGD